jgi:hypothetical protein
MVPNGYLNLGWETDRRFATCMEAITSESVLAAWDDLMLEAVRGERPLNAAAQ